MRSLLTCIIACNRPELLEQTKTSLIANTDFNLKVEVYDDLQRIGQNWNLMQAYEGRKGKYVLHVEDDWSFDDTNKKWVNESLKILRDNPFIIKVINRKDAIHPAEFNYGNYAILDKWIDPWKFNEWHGFGWNCGVTRLDLLQEFFPLKDFSEQEISKIIYDAGYRTALLKNSTATHIGEGQSTHL